ncbi:MAG: hypothetical protein H5T47_05390 [Archaeoglobi archaeon]|nr:hypothetical protein [Candidatus Mnemosynella bozhongmuii]
MKRIRIKVGDVTVEGELKETETARKIWEALPISSTAERWGDEIYFSTGVKAELEEGASEIVELGDIAYWPPGKAICLFFGKTPVSRGDEIRAASPVNVFGKMKGDFGELRSCKDGDRVIVERVEE